MMTSVRVLHTLATRNLRRQARRSILAGSATLLGVALLVFSRSLATGAHEDWINSGVRMGAGHLVLQAPRYQASRNLDDRLTPAALEAAREAIHAPSIRADVVAVAPRLEVQGLASAAADALPALIAGIDPIAESEFSGLGERRVDGRYLEAGDRLHAYVGVRLADRLKLRVGSRLVLNAQNANGELAGQFVRVVGTFRTGIPEADESLIQIPLSTAQDWLEVDDGATSLAVLLRSGWRVPDVLERVRRAAGGRTDLAILSWQQSMPELDAAIKVDDLGDYVFQVVLFGIIALAIVNTVLMSVLHRRREFGVLRALGLTKGQTARVVFAEGVLLTLASGVAGLVVGLSVTWIFFRNGLDYSAFMESDFQFSGVVLDTIIVPSFRLKNVVLNLGSIVLVGVLASTYPAYRAMRIDIAEAMKFET